MTDATVTLNLVDALGEAYDPTRTKVWVELNSQSGFIIDEDGKTRTGAGRVTVNTDGSVQITGIPVPSEATNPTDFQVRINYDAPPRAAQQRNVKRDRGTFGWMTITADADLADLVAEQYAPPAWQSTFMTQAQALLDQQVALSGIDDTDSAVGALMGNEGVGPLTRAATRELVADDIADSGSDIGSALSASIETAVAAAVPSTATIEATVSSGTYTLNPSTGTDYTLTLTGEATLAATGLANGQFLYVEVVQDSTGGHTLTLDSSWLGASGITLAETANTFEVLVLWKTPLGVHVDHKTADGPIDVPFSYELLPGLRGLWVGDDIAGDENDPIALWTNRVDGEINLGQNNASSQPLLKVVNGHVTLQFDGGNDQMAGVDPTSGTASDWIGGALVTGMAFGVVKQTGDTSTNRNLFGGTNAASEWLFYKTSGSAQFRAQQGTMLASGVTDTNDWIGFVILFKGDGTSEIRIESNTPVVGNMGTESFTGLKLMSWSSNTNRAAGSWALAGFTSGIPSSDLIDDTLAAVNALAAELRAA